MSDHSSLEAVLAAVSLEAPEIRRHTSPDGMTTILFTDVQDSTLLMESLGEERWIEILRAHNALVRARTVAHGGEVVKFQGDGFMLAFASATGALTCAVELQRVFAAYSEDHQKTPLRVRVGLHTGSVISEGPDFLGKTVVMAARISAHAHGGEVLVSEMTKSFTERSVPFGFGAALDVGLKGFAGSHVLYPVVWDDAEAPPRQSNRV